MERIYKFAGGRKMFAQYLAVGLLTAMAALLGASFLEYAVAVCAALGLTVGGIAYEDARRGCGAAALDGGEASPGYRRPDGWRAEAHPEVDEP